MMNMGERITEEECNFLVEVTMDNVIHVQFLVVWTTWYTYSSDLLLYLMLGGGHGWWWLYQLWRVCVHDEECRTLQQSGWQLAGQTGQVMLWRRPLVRTVNYFILCQHNVMLSTCLINIMWRLSLYYQVFEKVQTSHFNTIPQSKWYKQKHGSGTLVLCREKSLDLLLQ